MPLIYCVIQRVLHIIYHKLDELSADIYTISNAYEGAISDRIGFNFPMTMVHRIIPASSLINYKADYIIAYQVDDIITKRHELQHAKYHMDTAYQKKIKRLWESFSLPRQQRILQKLQKMNYPDDPHILLDEFQAYYFTEKKGFFGKER